MHSLTFSAFRQVAALDTIYAPDELKTMAVTNNSVNGIGLTQPAGRRDQHFGSFLLRMLAVAPSLPMDVDEYASSARAAGGFPSIRPRVLCLDSFIRTHLMPSVLATVIGGKNAAHEFATLPITDLQSISSPTSNSAGAAAESESVFHFLTSRCISDCSLFI